MHACESSLAHFLCLSFFLLGACVIQVFPDAEPLQQWLVVAGGLRAYAGFVLRAYLHSMCAATPTLLSRCVYPSMCHASKSGCARVCGVDEQCSAARHCASPGTERVSSTVCGSPLPLSPIVRGTIADILPEDAHIRCSGKVFISITTVCLTGGLDNEIISEYVYDLRGV